MEGGDIAAGWTYRIVWVWEDLLGIRTGTATAETAYVRLHQWKRAIRCRQINEWMTKQMWQFAWKLNLRQEVVTFFPEGYADALRDVLDGRNLPISWVRSADEATWANDLASMIDIAVVLDPDPTRALRCGSRAALVRPDQIIRL